jgi:hypothetical protein
MPNACSTLAAPGSAGEPARSKHMVPMRDGVRLATVVYRPAEGPLPVIFIRGPYGKAPPAMAQPFCDHGYILHEKRVATNTIHMSAEHPSAVVRAGQSASMKA